jgi:hypothetical protein
MVLRVKRKNLAATYSRRSFTTTTIGKTAFDGRVRDGIGSGRSFMTTKNLLYGPWVREIKEHGAGWGRCPDL